MKLFKYLFVLLFISSIPAIAQDNKNLFSEEKNINISVLKNPDLNDELFQELIKHLDSKTEKTDTDKKVISSKNNNSVSTEDFYNSTHSLFSHKIHILDQLKAKGIINQKEYEESLKLVLMEKDKNMIVKSFPDEGTQAFYQQKLIGHITFILQILGSFFIFISFIYLINSLFKQSSFIPKLLFQIPLLIGCVYLSLNADFIIDSSYHFSFIVIFVFLSVFSLSWITYSSPNLLKNTYFITFNCFLLSFYFAFLGIFYQSYFFGTIATIYIGFFFSFLLTNAPILKNVNHSQKLKSFVLGHFFAISFYFFLLLSNHHLIIEHLPKLNYFIYGFQYYCPILISVGLLFLTSPFLHEKGQQTTLISTITFSLFSLFFILFGGILYYFFNLTLTPSIIAVFSFLFVLSWIFYIAYHIGYLLGTLLIGIFLYLIIQYLSPFYSLLNFMI